MANIKEIMTQFREQMHNVGLSYDGELICDGMLHRARTADDRKGRPFWYIFFDCGKIICGSAGCWKRDLKIKLCSNGEKKLTKAEKNIVQEKQKEVKRQYDEELEKRQAAARDKAKAIQNDSKPALEDHPYLVNKQVKSQGLLQAADGRLVIPLYDIDGILQNVQYITDDGDKKFLFGGKKKGCFFKFGDADSQVIHLSEGYATAYSVYAAIGGCAIVALDCYNLVEVAKIIRGKYPNKEILVCGDDDIFGEQNNGRKCATIAAETIGAKLFFPSFSSMPQEALDIQKPTDANDLKNLLGIEELNRQLAEHTKIIKQKTKLPENFKLNDKGLFYVEDDNEIFISSKLEIPALLRDEGSDNWGRLLEFVDPDGNPHVWGMPMEMLKGSGEDLRGELLNRGLKISTSRARGRLLEYIAYSDPKPRARCVTRIGWYKSVFVLPNQTIGDIDERVIYQTTHQVKDFAQKGTLEDWKDNVSRLCSGNSRLVFAVSTAFSAMLLSPTETESSGIHFVGASSIGKTTVLRVAASVYGAPNYLHNWRVTSNALEAMAALRNDCLLVLDEMGQVNPSDAGEIAYMLANGSGKGRANRSGGARARAEWRVSFISSGEIGLAQHMNEGGKKIKAGQQVRLVDIPADAEKGLGIFEDLHGAVSADAFSKVFTEAVSNYYGTAALQFLKVITEPGNLPIALGKLNVWRAQFIKENLPSGASGQVSRICQHFALKAAAGELATHVGITGWLEGESMQAAQLCFNAWRNERGSDDNQEKAAVLSHVKGFFETHGASRFTDTEHHVASLTINRAGFKTKVGDAYSYYVLPETFNNEVCKGFNPKNVTKMLKDAGWLECDSEGKSSRPVTLPGLGKKARCYIFNSKMWEA